LVEIDSPSPPMPPVTTASLLSVISPSSGVRAASL
jgi:hypothetical protein